MYVCMYVSVGAYVCMHARMYVSMHIPAPAIQHAAAGQQHAVACQQCRLCTYVCMYVCIHMYIGSLTYVILENKLANRGKSSIFCPCFPVPKHAIPLKRHVCMHWKIHT